MGNKDRFQDNTFVRNVYLYNSEKWKLFFFFFYMCFWRKRREVHTPGMDDGMKDVKSEP